MMPESICQRDGCGRGIYEPCASCEVVEDALRERGISDLAGLDKAVCNNEGQGWEFRDLSAMPLAITDGNDEPRFLWVVGFTDGRWAAIRGWHDYTGWDCQSGLRTEWYVSEADAMRTLVDWERDAAERLRTGR